MANARFVLAEAADEIHSAICLLHGDAAGAAEQAVAAMTYARQWLLNDADPAEMAAVKTALTMAARAAWWDTVDNRRGNGRYVEALIEIPLSILKWNFSVGPSITRRHATEDAKAAAQAFRRQKA